MNIVSMEVSKFDHEIIMNTNGGIAYNISVDPYCFCLQVRKSRLLFDIVSRSKVLYQVTDSLYINT